MRLDLQEIETFIQVVELGSVSQAAERLNISKSVVSKRLSDLERRLNANLLYRSTRKVTPTDNGVQFYQQSKAAISNLKEAAESATFIDSGLCGSMRVLAPMSLGTLWLAPRIAEFMKLHPRIRISLQLDDRLTDFEREGYDLCVRISRIGDSALIARPLSLSQRHLCCSPEYAAQNGTPGNISEIIDHSCIGYSNVPSTQVWSFQTIDPPNETFTLSPQGPFTTNNGEAMRDMVVQGMGLSVLPEFIIHRNLAEGSLISLEPGVRPIPDTIYALYPRSNRSSRKVLVLCDYLQQCLLSEPWYYPIEARQSRTSAG
ncbi:LysR family transcriptional regulator [Pseudomonas sp. TTU2014-080ASC]|uniref:LysR family transcriptional regulator n=1 Tax=Pseudomonas sp. TTU2014-080ASC TaxID=1729724 RepID=UPI0007187962|nr:LysR family transcriptional regulator [Pseudomonas sp. TTU2014-080ASC]KRW62561.1 LysR family transcriptional regulator [Pseudomonas sp. TTU2014-080ASC]